MLKVKAESLDCKPTKKRKYSQNSEPTSSQTKQPDKRAKKRAPKKEKTTLKSMAEQVLKAAGNSQKMLGVHVSASGGVENAIINAINMGCRSFALFVRNQRRWDTKPMSTEAIEKWDEAIKKFNYPLDKIIPHGSYLMNPGSPEPDKLIKTREAMLDECRRCESLRIKLYNFHPGSTVGKCSSSECIKNIAETINYIHNQTEFITLVVETMACTGNTIGGKFKELKEIIEQVNDKNRVGVCIDTCHIFAAGYDIRTEEAYNKTMEDFKNTIGFNYLKAVHLNDSKGKFNSHIDRHANIGRGELKSNAFKFLMKDSRFDDIPMVLETPEGMYEEEMIELYELEK